MTSIKDTLNNFGVKDTAASTITLDPKFTSTLETVKKHNEVKLSPYYEATYSLYSVNSAKTYI